MIEPSMDDLRFISAGKTPADRKDRMQQWRLTMLPKVVRRHGAASREAEDLAAAIIRAGGGDPYGKHPLATPAPAAWVGYGEGPCASTPMRFAYSWQVLVEQAAVP